MDRGYQRDFAEHSPAMYRIVERERKAKTMLAILSEHFHKPLNMLSILDVGASTGIIDNYLAEHFGHVVGIDIDQHAIDYASRSSQKQNLRFIVADAMNIPFQAGEFDVVICSQVYEHVPDANRMMEEIHRVLSKGGVCYFAATNRLKLIEPHHNLPFLSMLPKSVADFYMRVMGKGTSYYERHLTYWGLKQLVRKFEIIDFTIRTVTEPIRFGTDYMLGDGSLKSALARLLLASAYWLSPGYIWLLRKD